MKISAHFGLNLVDPNSYGGWNGYLQACVADAREMAVLAARAGFSARAVLNEEATVERMRTEVISAAKMLNDGDTFWLTYSGHGGRDGSMMSGYSETLCLFDGELADTALRELLSDFKANAKVVMFFDSCHSGGLDRARSRIRVKPHFVKSAVSKPARVLTPVGSVFMAAACMAEETALDGDENGAFTGSLLKVADESMPNLNWVEWLDATKRNMAKDFPNQHPQVLQYGSHQEWGSVAA